MFFGLTSASPAGPALSNLSFISRRNGRDRRTVMREMEGRMAALDHSQALIELSLDGKVLDANAKYLELLGLAPEQIMGKAYSSLLATGDREALEFQKFWSAALIDKGASARLSHKGRDGQTVSLRLAFAPVMGDDGKAGCVFGQAVDETERAAHDVLDGHTRLALENVSVAVMMVNRDFIVTHVNQATKNLLITRSAAFRKLWPNFDPANIVGTCIDTFHRDPSHQRRMLSDPAKLPMQTDISVGDIKFALSVSARYDAAGNYDGNILEWLDVTEIRTQQGQIAALDRVQAVIEFGLDGRILHANENFLARSATAWTRSRGQHHSMFVDPGYRTSAEYRLFWDKLGRGEYDAGQYKRIGKGGREVWIQASYNPILDLNGKPFKVVKYATDITEQKLATANFEGQLAAIGKAQAVIEFGMDGKVLTANDNFLATLGYTLPRIHGQHHSMFVDPVACRSARVPRRSGKSSAAANTMPASTSGSPRAAARSGSRPATTRSST